MRTQVLPIEHFLGIMTNFDEVNMPFGGALSMANMSQFTHNRLQRIPGVVDTINIANADGYFPESWPTRISGTDYLMTAIVDAGGTGRVWNVTSAAEVTGGTALTDTGTGLLANIWSSTEYLGQQFISNGIQPMQRITAATTKVDVTGTPTPPKGMLIKSYFGRLYCAGLTEVAGVTATDADKSKVWYSVSLDDVTDMVFSANAFLNCQEVPGEITSLAINSPTTAAGTIAGELVVGKRSGIMKLTGDPGDGGSALDVVSSSVGTDAPHTFVNTPVGLLFMGISFGKRSIYYLPIGSSGEPQEIGQGLLDVLNADSPDNLGDPRLSRAVYHDGFYKLFIKRGTAIVEVWADITEFIRSQRISWYGIHTRGVRQAPTVTSDGVLNVFEIVSAQGKHFTENTDKTSTFIDSSASVLVAELDIPLNVAPDTDEKAYDLLSLFIAKEANTSGNALSVESFSEGVSQNGPDTVSIFDSTVSVGFTADIPIIGSAGAGLTGDTARLKLRHTSNARLDILKARLQYLAHEGTRSKNEP